MVFGDPEANAIDTPFGHAFLSEMVGHLPRLIVCSVVQWKPWSEISLFKFFCLLLSYDLQ